MVKFKSDQLLWSWRRGWGVRVAWDNDGAIFKLKNLVKAQHMERRCLSLNINASLFFFHFNGSKMMDFKFIVSCPELLKQCLWLKLAIVLFCFDFFLSAILGTKLRACMFYKDLLKYPGPEKITILKPEVWNS